MTYKKKSLGQHFLTDQEAAKQIADALEPVPERGSCLEIGPGEGALTRFLLERPELNLCVCELDDRFAERLPKKFPALKDRVLHRDFLTVSESELPPAPMMLVGNFPYNISSQIIFKMLDWKDRIPVMVGMFQREVAQRLCAGPGGRDYGVVSVLAGAWYEAEYLFELPPGSFSPPPKVHSAVIRMIRRERDPMPDEQLFRRIAKTAFHQRRKKLRNALHGLYEDSILQHPFFDFRAEDLSVATYELLAQHWPELPPADQLHGSALAIGSSDEVTHAGARPQGESEPKSVDRLLMESEFGEEDRKKKKKKSGGKK